MTAYYQNSNGAVYCTEHLGCSARGFVQNDPDIISFTTDLDHWERMTHDEEREFAHFLADLIGGEPSVCEQCRGWR